MTPKTAAGLALIVSGTVSILYGLGTETMLVAEVMPTILLYVLGVPTLFCGIHFISTEKTEMHL